MLFLSFLTVRFELVQGKILIFVPTLNILCASDLYFDLVMFLFNFIFVEVYFVAKQYFPPYCQYELFNLNFWFVRTQLLKNFGCMNFVLEVIFSCFSYVEAGGSCFHLFMCMFKLVSWWTIAVFIVFFLFNLL